MQLSNKTLAVMLVVATSVSLLGTIATLGKLQGITPSYVTGRAASDTGQSNFTINASLNILFTTNLVDFGTGNVNSSGPHNCTLNTSLQQNTTDCIGFNANQSPLVVQNQGTQNVTLNISFNSTAAQFVGGTSPSLTFNASINETGACGAPLLNNVTTAVTAANQNYSVCNTTGFNWVTNNRTLNLGLGIKIPQDAPAGQRYIVITAYAASP